MRTSVEWRSASRPRRVQGKPRRRRQDQRSSTSQGKDSIDQTTRTVIDTVGETDDKRIAWTRGAGARTTLYWSRTDGRQPSCNHPLRTPNQIASGCKAKNCIHGSAAAQRERRPRAENKVQGQDTYLFALDDLIQSKATGNIRGATRAWCGKEIDLNHTPLFRIGTLHQVYGRTTPSFHQCPDDRSACQAASTRSTSAAQILHAKEPLRIKKTVSSFQDTTRD